jgi:hypothetical protein
VLKVTVIGFDVPTPLHASVFVVVTVNVPLALTAIDCVVSPFDHKYDSAVVDVKVTVSPVQAVKDEAEIEGQEHSLH